MIIAVDAMAGDHGPGVIVEGAVQAAREFGVEVMLVGLPSELEKHLAMYGGKGLSIHIHPATQVVEMGESPAESLRRKKDSSIKVAFELVQQGRASAVISAGNSGATLATAMFTLGRISGIRPAIATVMPTLKEPVVMIDVGANVDCKPSHLYQFALMGSVFSSTMFRKQGPRVGLLSIGEEHSKGNQQVKKAHDLLASSKLNFIGNVEGRDIFKGETDVIVCDGFVGNVCLKLSEGLAESMMEMMKKEMSESIAAKVGYALSKAAIDRFKKRVDWAEYGGAPLLGVKGVAIICHGKSGAKAVKNAIRVANNLAQENFLHNMEKAISNFGLVDSTDSHEV